MKTKLITAGLLLAAFTMPAFAEDTYYVVRDATTKKCTVVNEKPTTTTTTVTSDGTVYKTRTEAENAVKTTKVCTSD
jgi:hypothetical protein